MMLKTKDKRLNALLDVVIQYHGSQKRKYTAQPYWIHLKTVATLTAIFKLSPLSCAVALCHDLLEDTDLQYKSMVLRGMLFRIGYSRDEVNYIFEGVIALTDVYTHKAFPGLNRATRKELEHRRLSKDRHPKKKIK